MHDQGLTLYLIEADKHRQRYLVELDELKLDLDNDNFRRRDYRALERLLQIFTELCVGLSKHWVKLLQKETPSEAYQSFMLLRENGVISSDELIRWRKIIGMRNGLVHDYLNIDLLILENVLREAHYTALNDFSIKAISALKNKFK